jgi:glutamyl-tRNA reductase
VANEATGPVLSNLFRQAIHTGKRVRTETAISQNAISISYAAVEMARKICGDLPSRTALIIGAGEMAELALKTLVDNGVGRVLVTNRTWSRALDLAARFSGEAIAFPQLETALAQSDVVISSTAARGFVLTTPLVHSAMQNRSHRPLFLMDIAVPRDIDPDVQNLNHVSLCNVDDLEAVCQANLQERAQESRQAEAIVEEEVQRFKVWFDTLEVVPTISALHSWAEDIRQAELARAMPRLHDLSERDRNTINALTAAIVNKMLHPATIGLKNGGHHHARVIRELFHLKDDGYGD